MAIQVVQNEIDKLQSRLDNEILNSRQKICINAAITSLKSVLSSLHELETVDNERKELLTKPHKVTNQEFIKKPVIDPKFRSGVRSKQSVYDEYVVSGLINVYA